MSWLIRLKAAWADYDALLPTMPVPLPHRVARSLFRHRLGAAFESPKESSSNPLDATYAASMAGAELGSVMFSPTVTATRAATASLVATITSLT